MQRSIIRSRRSGHPAAKPAVPAVQAPRPASYVRLTPWASTRIDELARLAGATVRNIRVYQDRGLLAPPRRDGRVGIYTDAHLARLRLIGQLYKRGYSAVCSRARGQGLALGTQCAQGLRYLPSGFRPAG